MKNGIKTYSIKNPQASYCGDYIVVASKNGNEIALLDSDGQMKKFSVSYPIVDLEVAKQGVIALILHGDNGNYIELYDAAQKKLVTNYDVLDEAELQLEIIKGTAVTTKFSLVGDDVHGSSGHVSYSTWIANATITVKSGSKASDVIVKHLSSMDIQLSAQQVIFQV